MRNAFSRYDQERRQALMEQFQDFQQNNTVTSENKCRYAMLFCILREYVRDQQKTMSTADIYQNVEMILESLKSKKPNFMDQASYIILMTELRNTCSAVSTSKADTIKLAFARRLPAMLNPTLLAQDVTNDLNQNKLTPEVDETENIDLSNETVMLLTGYYDVTLQTLKECINDPWVNSL